MFELSDYADTVVNKLHNLANDLKSGLIDWSEFDEEVRVIIINAMVDVVAMKK